MSPIWSYRLLQSIAEVKWGLFTSWDLFWSWILTKLGLILVTVVRRFCDTSVVIKFFLMTRQPQAPRPSTIAKVAVTSQLTGLVTATIAIALAISPSNQGGHIYEVKCTLSVSVTYWHLLTMITARAATIWSDIILTVLHPGTVVSNIHNNKSRVVNKGLANLCWC